MASPEASLHLLLEKKALSICFAESCTGGNLASRMTALPGASQFFLGSFVTYSTKLKEKILGVSKSTIEREGQVSKAVALEMAQGAVDLTGADITCSTTGWTKPGVIWIAIQTPSTPLFASCLHLEGGREEIIRGVGDYVFNTLLTLI